MTDSDKHSAARTILGSPRSIYRALLDPETIVSWRPPEGMTAKIFHFDPQPGGGYRMALFFNDDAEAAAGKSSVNADILNARFVELIPEEKIIEAITFEGKDPVFSGTMTFTTRLTPVRDGTKVTFVAENAPSGISEADHKISMAAMLKNLANLVE